MSLSTQDGAKPTVVVVENDAALVSALKFALELEGFGVATFRSSSEVLAGAELPSNGCIVVDFNLAGMNGLDLVAELREREVNLPAILIAGRATPSLRLQAKAVGAPVVEKPLLGNVLIDAIREALDGSA